MRVKKFIGKTMQEAVASLRQEFGRDAVILHTTQKRRWFWGRIGPKHYEVLGAIDPNYTSSNRAKTKPKPKPTTSAHKEAVVNEKPLNPTLANFDPSWSDAIQSLYGRLVRLDIPKDIAQDLLKEVLSGLPKVDWNNEEQLWQGLNSVVTKRIKTLHPWEFTGEQRVVVLIGPTGVGKTTTVAKLAANFALVGGLSVGLITVDTYRIAAVDQLKTYAEIIGLPVHVAYSPRELKEGLLKMQGKDLVLIDTAGRSQNNYLQISELKNYLDDITAEIHLVISATTKPGDVDEIIKAFGQLKIDRVIITKLDETNAYGIILHTCERAKAPLAYVTTGQGVPEDIDVADSEKIARLILGDAQ